MSRTTEDQNIAAALSVTGGLELAHHLLYGVNNVNARIATQLLGRHRSGYWLRQFCVPDTGGLAGIWYVIDMSRTPVTVN